MIGRNNPLNIRYSPVNKWKGQSGFNRGFCNFRNIKYCIRAVYKIIMSYSRRGISSYLQIITAYAPYVENPTSNYVSYVCAKCKVSPLDTPVSFEDYATLIYYMWCFEQGKSPSLSVADIELIISDSKFIFDGSSC